MRFGDARGRGERLTMVVGEVGHFWRRRGGDWRYIRKYAVDGRCCPTAATHVAHMIRYPASCQLGIPQEYGHILKECVETRRMSDEQFCGAITPRFLHRSLSLYSGESAPRLIWHQKRRLLRRQLSCHTPRGDVNPGALSSLQSGSVTDRAPHRTHSQQLLLFLQPPCSFHRPPRKRMPENMPIHSHNIVTVLYVETLQSFLLL